jgi:hypothetical protein
MIVMLMIVILMIVILMLACQVQAPVTIPVMIPVMIPVILLAQTRPENAQLRLIASVNPQGQKQINICAIQARIKPARAHALVKHAMSVRLCFVVKVIKEPI